MINRTSPQYPDGKVFGTHWFSDTSSFSVKKEKIDLPVSQTIRRTIDSPAMVSKSFSPSIVETLYSSENALIAASPSVTDQVCQLVFPEQEEKGVNLPVCESERVQSWINSQQPLEECSEKKAIPVEYPLEGRHILPKVLETLRNQTERLRTSSFIDTEHVGELDKCVSRVYSFHKMLDQNLSHDHHGMDGIEWKIDWTPYLSQD